MLDPQAAEARFSRGESDRLLVEESGAPSRDRNLARGRPMTGLNDELTRAADRDTKIMQHAESAFSQLNASG